MKVGDDDGSDDCGDDGGDDGGDYCGDDCDDDCDDDCSGDCGDYCGGGLWRPKSMRCGGFFLALLSCLVHNYNFMSYWLTHIIVNNCINHNQRNIIIHHHDQITIEEMVNILITHMISICQMMSSLIIIILRSNTATTARPGTAFVI